jgi:hypothetical protein
MSLPATVVMQAHMRCPLSRRVPSRAPLVAAPLPRLRASQHRKQGIACAGLFQQPAYDKYRCDPGGGLLCKGERWRRALKAPAPLRRDPHDIENSFWKRIEDLACLTDEQKERRLTPWSFIAALPMIIKYRVLPFQVRFIWYIVWFYLRQAAYRVHKAAVLQGACSLVTARDAGSAAGGAAHQRQLPKVGDCIAAHRRQTRCRPDAVARAGKPDRPAGNHPAPTARQGHSCGHRALPAQHPAGESPW